MYTPMKYMRFMICNERKERHMFNEITIGPLTLHTYGLMIGLGFLAAYAMCYYRGKKMKMEKSLCSIWRNYRRNLSILALLQDKEGIFHRIL